MQPLSKKAPLNGVPSTNQRSVCDGESGGLEDFNEAVLKRKPQSVSESAEREREVAQLVAHYVRDVGVGRSSRLFSTVSDFGIKPKSLFVCQSL